MPDEPTQDPKSRLDELRKQLDELIRRREGLADLLDQIPLARLSRLLQKLAKLINLLTDLPAELWQALIAFVACNNEALAALAVDQLKKLLEVLKAVAEVELETADPNDPEDQALIQGLEAWIQELCETLDSWDPEQTQEAALEAVVALKQFLRDHYPEILEALVLYFGEDIAREIGEWAENQIGSVIKRIIKKIIDKILVKRLGKEAAKRLAPLVGTVLTLIEFFLILGILDAIKSLDELIDLLMAEIVRELVEQGMGWPNNYEYVWFADPYFCDATVTKKPKVHCAKKNEDGKLEFSNPCPVEFADGGTSKTVQLTKEDNPNYDPDTGVWKCPYTIDEASVNGSDCVQDAEVCYVFIELTITDKDGNTTTHAFIIGAKVF